MQKIVDWIKGHKAISVVIAAVIVVPGIGVWLGGWGRRCSSIKWLMRSFRR